MKLFSVTCLSAAAAWQGVSAESVSPVSKVIEMLADLQSKVIKEGETSQKIYSEFSEWCEDRASNLGHEIKTGQAQVESLKATISSEVSTSASLTAKIEDLAGSIAVDEADLKAATHIRSVETKDFGSSESELSDIISMLQRSIGILEREKAKGGASMLQFQNAQNFADALTIMVKSSFINSADAGKLTAMLQSNEKSNDEDQDMDVGAPSASVYNSHSSDIIETLEQLMNTAESQLDESRKKEIANTHNFQLLKQSLEDEIRFGNKDMLEAKKALAASSKSKSTADGDLAVTSNELGADKETKSTLHHDCMTKAEDFEAEVKSRTDELNALAEAKKVLKESVDGATDLSYSFLQVSRANVKSGVDLANIEAVRLVRDLAHKEKSSALAQLAQRMSADMAFGATSNSDPFAKVRGLISDMISKLESEAGADATRKAYCDKELMESNVKKTDKNGEISKLNTHIDKMKARSAMLKEEIADLQNALAKLASTQASMNQIRGEEHSTFVSNKADMEKGLTGVKMALKILSEYYAGDDKAHEEASGAGKSIIGLLEVIESDFTKNLAEMVSTEESGASSFDRATKDNHIEKSTKDKDVEYKIKESTYLDKESSELSTDREGVQAELDAVLEYLSKIEEQCIAKAETYDERKRRFGVEIVGLKEALNILESETALVQRRSLRHRGMQHHVAV